jgi:hypothetical protein
MSGQNGTRQGIRQGSRERRCYVCGHKECVPPLRIFLRPDEPDRPVPRCPLHGAMARQPNKRYGGRK